MIKRLLAFTIVVSIISGFSFIGPENSEAQNLEFVERNTPIYEEVEYTEKELEIVEKAKEIEETPRKRSNGKWVWAIVTAYEPSSVSCGEYADGKTATGKNVNSGDPHDAYGFAVDPRAIAYGKKIYIELYWNALQRNKNVNFRPKRMLESDDTGSAMRRSWDNGIIHIDVRFRTVAACKKWGVKKLRVFIYD